MGVIKNKKMISVFLPIRKNSQRVSNKNVKDFAGVKGGLTKIKLTQLLKLKEIDRIIVSTDCNSAIHIANSFKSNKIQVDLRPENLCLSSTTTDELILYVNKIVQEGLILWTHVTSPLFNDLNYREAIKIYHEQNQKFDSLMSVSIHKGFYWKKNNPINYDRNTLKWPFTQDVEPIIEINNAVFIADSSIYKKHSDRIGKNPYLLKTSKINSFDIDWETDFDIAEQIYLNNVRN